MGSTYADAPEVADVARSLIPRHHDHLLGDDIRIEYLFVDPPPESKGKMVFGRCRKVTGINAFLSDRDPDDPVGNPYFVVEIAEQVWRVLEPEQRIALVDHELCHAMVIRDEEDVPKLSIRPHDVEEFSDIVERHGLWDTGLQEFVERALSNKAEG